MSNRPLLTATKSGDFATESAEQPDAVDFDCSTVDYDIEPVGNSNALLDSRRWTSARRHPPIDFPIFVSIEDATSIVAVTVDGVAKGYPIRVLTV
jgi:hypothetical protein